MPLMAVPVPRAVERTALVISVGLLAAGAWIALWLAGGSLHGWIHRGGMDHLHGSSDIMPFLFIGGWTVMTVAMMLPSTLPILATFHAIALQRRDRTLLVGLVVLGYVLTWTIFGVAVYAGYVLLGNIAASSAWVQEQLWLGTPLIFFLAGIFQFTPLKYRCLDKCRSPLSFVIEHWQGRDQAWQAFRLGVDHGIFCVGCCWALMLLMFGAGLDHIGWMLILAVVMGVEKNVTWGRRMSRPLGVLLIGCGVVLLALA